MKENGIIKDARFDGEACAICTSSTSIMNRRKDRAGAYPEVPHGGLHLPEPRRDRGHEGSPRQA